MNNTLRIAIETLILTGCVTAPMRDAALEDVRAEVDALSQESLAQRPAADDLRGMVLTLGDVCSTWGRRPS
jgi:hypothetical protein